MKTIFIVTDFSEAAKNAAEYGVALAEYLGAELVLFHAYDIPVSIPDSYFEIHPQDMQRDAEQQLLLEVKRIRRSENQAIAIIAAVGNTVEVALKAAAAYPRCVLVAGIKNEAVGLRRLFGSTVTSLTKNGKLPVLLIPEGYRFLPLTKLMLAVDTTTMPADDGLHWLQSLGNRFSAKLFVVQVLRDKGSEILFHKGWELRFTEQLSSLDSSLHFVHDEHIHHGLQAFVEENNIQLLCLMHHQHHFFDKLFHPSQSKLMIFDTRIPLMILSEA